MLGGKDTVDGLIALYRASPAFTQLQGTTRSGYDIRLQVISKKIGSMPVAALPSGKVKLILVNWHESMAATPSAADLTMAVLSRLFSWASKRGLIEANPMRDGYERLSRGTRRDQIWSAQEIEILRTQARTDMRDAALMALWTMQRQGDLLTMTPMAYSQSTGMLRIKQQKNGRVCYDKTSRRDFANHYPRDRSATSAHKLIR
ncbi:MAG: hypothetical protein U5K75_08915 [Ahrensia sp.]|nr:hypothetical protein [Ahrensia sp.]